MNIKKKIAVSRQWTNSQLVDCQAYHLLKFALNYISESGAYVHARTGFSDWIQRALPTILNGFQCGPSYIRLIWNNDTIFIDRWGMKLLNLIGLKIEVDKVSIASGESDMRILNVGKC